MKTIALIAAGGKSERFGRVIPKQFNKIAGKPLLSWTIERFEKAESIDQIVVVVAEEYLLYTSEKVIDPFNFQKIIKIVIGGKSRQESVLKGLEALPISTSYVAIHDGARPLVSPVDINRVVNVAINERAAILAIKSADTIKRVKDDFIITTLKRDFLYQAQTPQVFQYDLIIDAHRKFAAYNDNITDAGITDDASLIEANGFKVKIIEPTTPNLKVTTRADLIMAETLITREDNG